MILHFSLQPFHCKTLPVKMQVKMGKSFNNDRFQYWLQPVKFVNLVFPSPCEAAPYNNLHYYMTSSASGQDEPNRALRLATRAGKMEPSCPLGTTRCIPQAKFPQKPYNKSFIDQVCSVKMAGYKELGQYPAILTSHLVNNPYLLSIKHCLMLCLPRYLLQGIYCKESTDCRGSGPHGSLLKSHLENKIMC